MKKALLWSLSVLVIAGVGFFAVPYVTGTTTPQFTMSTDADYVDGKFDQALALEQDDVPYFAFEGHDGLNPSGGTIEACIKPSLWATSPNGYWEIASGVDQDGQDVFEFRRGKDATLDNLQFIAYGPSGGFQAWKTTDSLLFAWDDDSWYYFVLTWSESSPPIIYVNATAHTLVPAYGETTWTIRDFSSGKIFLGQRGNDWVRGNHTYNHAGRASFDEVRFSNTVRTASEIETNYNSGDGTLVTVDNETIWLAHFDESLDIDNESDDESDDNAKWLMREVRKCDTLAFDTSHPDDGDQDFEIDTYGNYRCGNRYHEQCILDGTFDSYYSETCHYPATGERVISTTLTSVEIDGAYLKATWKQACSDDFGSYILVISEEDDTPSYPENFAGWMTTDNSTISVNVPHAQLYYDNSNTSKLTAGHTYYVAIGIRYSSGFVKVSNVVELEVPDFNQFYAYSEDLNGGYYIDSKDLDGDGLPEIITGTGEGLGPQISIFDSEGNVQSRCFAYAASLRSGVRVAAGDLDGDGSMEIITAAGPSGAPHIQIFNQQCERTSPGFFALDGKFRGGTHVTTGDINGDGLDDIIVTAGRGGGAHVMAYDKNGNVMLNFFAYDQDTFRGGIRATTVDVDGDGKDEIVTGPEFGSPHVQIFQYRNGEAHRLNPGFYAFSESFTGGLSLTGADVDGDGIEEIVVSAGHDSASIVRVFNLDGTFVRSDYYAYTEDFTGGVNVTSADIDGDGKDEILTIPAANGEPNVRSFKLY